MKKKQFSTMGKHPLIGAVVAIVITVIMSAMIAWLLLQEKLDISAIRICAWLTQFTSALCGCIMAGRGERGIIKAAIAGAAYILILFSVNALFLDGAFKDAIWSIIAVLLGFGASAIVNYLPKKHTRRPRRKR